MKDYIFICEGDNSSICLIDAQSISNYLKKACKALGFNEKYTAINLRVTHMTKAFEHVLRNGKSNIELSVLSKHKRIDTTKNHYIEMELEKMLEATYGIIIGDSSKLIDVDSKIVDEIPSNLVDSEVDDGCGNCSIKDCVMISALTSLPCFLCDYFITTVGHLKFFVKAIENVDMLISYAKTMHDKEDLITTKTLYVLYLKAIYKRKEELQ